jgi:ERCC4-type nuclease
MNKKRRMDCIVDYRERVLIKELERHQVLFTNQSLPVGDIMYMKDKIPLLIIERKTVADLKASICDGRHREQKARLRRMDCPVMYIVEGNMDKSLQNTDYGIPIGTLVGALMNTQLRDNCFVYKTASVHETVVVLSKLSSQLGKEYSIPTTYASTRRGKRKRDCMTPDVWFSSQLQLIPQCSSGIATAIAEKYTSPRELMEMFEHTTARHKLLADLPYVTKSGKTRMVGPKVAERICNFFYGQTARVLDID